MTLTAGMRIGPYEIQSPLGAGDMGEVYRARDTKLDREVAIKILPDYFVHDPDRVARLFEVRRRTENYFGFGTGGVYDVAPDGKRFPRTPAPRTIARHHALTRPAPHRYHIW